MPKTTTLESRIDGFAFIALRAAAEGKRRGGVVVLQQIFGLDRFVQADLVCWSALFEANGGA